MAAKGSEQKLVDQIVNAIHDDRFNPHLFGRLAQEQTVDTLLLEATCFLAFFEMLHIRWTAGDVTEENHNLLRIAAKVTEAWREETLT